MHYFVGAIGEDCPVYIDEFAEICDLILANLGKQHEQGVVPSGSVAILHGALGESNEAFAWLESLRGARPSAYIHEGRAQIRALRHDARFQDLQRRIGLPP